MCPVSTPHGWSICAGRTVTIDPPTRRDAVRVAEMFGLRQGRSEQLYDDLRLTVRPGEIVAVVGPSGAGKTVLLREIARQVGPDAIWLGEFRLGRCDAPPVTCLRGGPLADRLELLSRCGLADAAALITPARFLSGGQRHRLALAAALHKAGRRNRRGLLLADEFCATLDPATAQRVCRQVRRMIRPSTKTALVAALPQPSLLAALQPDRLVVKPLGEPGRIRQLPAEAKDQLPPETDWPIELGSIHDYDRLGRFHYLAGRPAAHKRVYVVRLPPEVLARIPHAPTAAGVAVVSPPVLDCRARNAVTTGRFAGPDRKAAVARLNAEMECISRVVVHPIFRGAGLAVRLVRHVLDTAPTRYVEALAAMGAIHPFFAIAGMTDHGRHPGRRGEYSYYLADTHANATPPQED
ncbi:MAG: ATP-binding cassette domain-containing protein [Phycisphaerae bacterium]